MTIYEAELETLSGSREMKFIEAEWTLPEDATLNDLKSFLKKAETIVANGRFVITVGTDQQSKRMPENYLFHHFRPNPLWPFDDTKQVGRGGDVATCIRDLGEYVCSWNGGEA
jgi:hypothetical protein